jgi:hypothetical protein
MEDFIIELARMEREAIERALTRVRRRDAGQAGEIFEEEKRR